MKLFFGEFLIVLYGLDIIEVKISFYIVLEIDKSRYVDFRNCCIYSLIKDKMCKEIFLDYRI